MRKYLMLAACAAALALSACTERSESYTVPSADAYAKLAGAGYAEGIYPLPSGLAGADVSLSFEAVPTDQTAVWKFTRDGKEVARVNAVVEGDGKSSKISYSYAAGDGAAANEKVERQIKQFMPMLIAEAVDARIENRPIDRMMKNNADAMTMTAMVGDMMAGASAAMDKAVKEQNARHEASAGSSDAASAKYNSTKPTTDLSKY
jgi:hypothetical protein